MKIKTERWVSCSLHLDTVVPQRRGIPSRCLFQERVERAFWFVTGTVLCDGWVTLRLIGLWYSRDGFFGWGDWCLRLNRSLHDKRHTSFLFLLPKHSHPPPFHSSNSQLVFSIFLIFVFSPLISEGINPLLLSLPTINHNAKPLDSSICKDISDSTRNIGSSTYI